MFNIVVLEAKLKEKRTKYKISLFVVALYLVILNVIISNGMNTTAVMLAIGFQAIATVFCYVEINSTSKELIKERKKQREN